MSVEIVPNSTIVLCSGVPFDINYRHTAYFGGTTGQNQYISNFGKISLSQSQYQRITKNELKINIKNYENPQSKRQVIYSCNYLFFKNINYENKYIYAFITDIEYINNFTYKIRYEIDVMQTWLPNIDYILKPCYIERQHTTTDNIGEHTVPEHVEIGDYVNDTTAPFATHIIDNMCLVIDVPLSWSREVATGKYAFNEDRMFHVLSAVSNPPAAGTHYPNGDACTIVWGINSIILNLSKPPSIIEAELEAIFNGLVTSGKSLAYVKSIRAVPIPNVAWYDTGGAEDVFGIVQAGSYSTFSVGKYPAGFEGYHPKNKKLYTYPYCFLYAQSPTNSAVYKFENFGSEYCDFAWWSSSVNGTIPTMYPLHYKNTSNNAEESLQLAPNLMFSISSDAYDNWVAQYNANGALKSAATILTSTLTAGVGSGFNPVVTTTGALMSTVKEAMNVGTSALQSMITPPQLTASASNIINYVNRTYDFIINKKTIKREYAERIDDFFSMYGYAIGKIGTPNLQARPYWTYIKTIGSNCQCSTASDSGLPASMLAKINNNFDNGITFWKSAYYGNYNLDNSPASS